MARALLISCNVTREPYPVYPLGVSMVADAARRKGHQVRVWDLRLGEEGQPPLEALIREFKPQAIGLGMRNIDNFNYDSQESYTGAYRNLVQALKGMSDAPIVAGGSAYSLFAEPLLEACGADFGVQGEGEEAFAGFLAGLDRGQLPAARILRPAEPQSGAGILAAEREPLLAEWYLKHGGMLNVQAKRGCPLACAYCSYPSLEGDSYRFREPAALADEMLMLQERHGADYIALVDSVFNDTQRRWVQACEELIRRGSKVPWMAFFRPMRFKPEDLALLKRAGCASVEFGTDCSTDATLAGMRKSFGWAEVEESSRLFSQAGISTSHFIIFGGPGETEATVRQGLANISRLEGTVVFACAGVRVMPGTEVHRLALRQGRLAASDSLLEPRYYFDQVEPAWLHQAIVEGFGGRRDRVYPPTPDLDKVSAFHTLGYRGPVWDMLLGRKRTRRGEA
jgi:radical SAM superfamily enzyme YgiQ (UPF0313 family)